VIFLEEDPITNACKHKRGNLGNSRRGELWDICTAFENEKSRGADESYLDNRDILSSRSSEFLSMSSAVSICSSVPDLSSNMMGVGGAIGPHSSDGEAFSILAAYQQAVVMEPFDPESTRN
jgi:hypothetical protein